MAFRIVFTTILLLALASSADAVPCREWDVTVRVTSVSEPASGISFEIGYGESGGKFPGAEPTVDCKSRVAGAIFAAGHPWGTQTIRVAAITLKTLPLPGPLATCRFLEYSADTPTADQFSLTLLSANNTRIEPIQATGALEFEAAGELMACGDRCGDGLVDERYEQCDDGNNLENDDCASNCQPPLCGNGDVDAENEECDDGNDDDQDACLNGCTLARCGDTVIWFGHETCDDGNTWDGDRCPSNCGPTLCGNGAVDADGEECDDGNRSDHDDCLRSCKVAICGDRVVHTGEEQCDDGNTASTDACTADCIRATCGDGFVREGVERCDDGNQLNGDDCPSDCDVIPVCGDTNVDGLIKASDAQLALRAAAGMDVECPRWAGDTDAGGISINTSDALRILKRAVGQPVILQCVLPSQLLLRLAAPADLSTLVADIDVSSLDASVVGEGTSVECESLVEGATMSFEQSPERVLRLTASFPAGPGPKKSIVTCVLDSLVPAAAADFPVTVIAADATDGSPIENVVLRAVPY
jgi:cysteine-rich repeat protein